MFRYLHLKKERARDKTCRAHTPMPLALENINRAAPDIPEDNANIRYKVGVSLLPSEPYVIVSHHTARRKTIKQSTLSAVDSRGSN